MAIRAPDGANKIPPEMEVAPHYTVLTLFILFKLLYAAYTVACMPIYILLMKSDVTLVTRGPN